MDVFQSVRPSTVWYGLALGAVAVITSAAESLVSARGLAPVFVLLVLVYLACAAFVLGRVAVEAGAGWIAATALLGGIASSVYAIAKLTGMLSAATTLPLALGSIVVGVIGGPMFAAPFRAIGLSRQRDPMASNIAPAPVRAISPLTPLIPSRRFVIDSPLPLATAHAHLVAATEPKRWLRFGASERPFEGRVDATSFEIWRIIGYRNSSKPRIRGTLVKAGDGTTVEGSMTLPLFTRIFAIIWFGGVLAACVVVLRAVVGGARDPALLIPFGMLAFGGLLVIGGFVFEVRKALRELGRVFGAAGEGTRQSR
jgi:hypothetical protein